MATEHTRQVASDKEISATAFIHGVKPLFDAYFQADTVVQYDRIIDQRGLIDGFIQLKSNKALIPFNSRIQWAEKTYDSFSFRVSKASGYKTELIKYIEMLEDPRLLRPYYISQSYFGLPKGDFGHLKTGVVEFQPLFEFISRELLTKNIKENPDDWGYRKNQYGDLFIFLNWSFLNENGVKVEVLSGSPPGGTFFWFSFGSENRKAGQDQAPIRLFALFVFPRDWFHYNKFYYYVKIYTIY